MFIKPFSIPSIFSNCLLNSRRGPWPYLTQDCAMHTNRPIIRLWSSVGACKSLALLSTRKGRPSVMKLNMDTTMRTSSTAAAPRGCCAKRGRPAHFWANPGVPSSPGGRRGTTGMGHKSVDPVFAGPNPSGCSLGRERRTPPSLKLCFKYRAKGKS